MISFFHFHFYVVNFLYCYYLESMLFLLSIALHINEMMLVAKLAIKIPSIKVYLSTFNSRKHFETM